MPLQRPTQLGPPRLSQVQLIWTRTAAASKGAVHVHRQGTAFSSACLMPLPLTRHILTAGACTHPSCPHVGLPADFAAACRPSLVQTMQQRAQQLSPPSPGNGPAQLSGFGEQALVDWLSYLHLDAEVRWFPCPHTPPLVAMEHVGANANAKLPPSLCPGQQTCAESRCTYQADMQRTLEPQDRSPCTCRQC